jgi:hypothetical protein
MTRVPQPSRDAAASDWTVYADALQESNDPRGELIALNKAVAEGMSPADRDAYVARHKEALFGGIIAANLDDVVMTWHFGLIDGVDVRVRSTATAQPLVAAVLALPAAAELRSFTLTGVGTKGSEVDLTDAMASLARQLPATCKALAFVDERASKTHVMVSRDFDPPDNFVKFGPFAPVAVNAESLRIETADAEQLDLGKLDAPELRSFTLRSLRIAGAYGDASTVPSALAEAQWPKLTSFELRLPEEFGANICEDRDAYNPIYFGDEDFEDRYDEAEEGENYEGINWSQLVPLLGNLKQCKLERLALTSFDSAQSVFDALKEAGLPPALVELDLSDSAINATDWFLANRDLLGQLKRLVLERTPLSEADVARLGSGLGPKVVHSPGSGASYRYIVGQE